MDISYLKTLIESDTKRKESVQMLYDFYQNDVAAVKEYIKDYMTKSTIQDTYVVNSATGKLEATTSGVSLFTQTTTNILPKYHRDITNKVLNNLCTAYSHGVDRYLLNEKDEVDEEQTELLNEVYRKAGIDRLQTEWYKQAKLMNIVEVKVVWRKLTDQLEFDIWTPNFFTVWENPENYLVKDIIIIDAVKFNPDGTEVDVKEVWTPTEHFYMVFKGKQERIVNGEKTMLEVWEKEAVGENKDMENPYGIIPFATLRFKIGQDYYGLGMTDLVEDNIWQDVRENNAFLVETYQGLGVLYAVNMGKSGTIPITPYTIVTVDNVNADKAKPEIVAVATNAPLSEIRENLKQNFDNIGIVKGLTATALESETQSASGVSKAWDNEERELNSLQDKIILTDFEERLFNIVKTVQNTKGGEKFNDNLKFVCDFGEKKTPIGLRDQLEKWKFEFDNGISTEIDYLISENPDLTIEQAKKQLKENAKIKEELGIRKPEPIIEPPPDRGGEPPDSMGD